MRREQGWSYERFDLESNGAVPPFLNKLPSKSGFRSSGNKNPWLVFSSRWPFAFLLSQATVTTVAAAVLCSFLLLLFFPTAAHGGAQLGHKLTHLCVEKQGASTWGESLVPPTCSEGTTRVVSQPHWAETCCCPQELGPSGKILGNKGFYALESWWSG